MNRRIRRRAIWLLERKRLLRGTGASFAAGNAAALDSHAPRAVVARTWLSAPRAERQPDGDGFAD